MNKSVDLLAVMNSALGDLMAAQVGDIDTETSVPELSSSIDAVNEIFKAADRIDQCSVRKAGGGWWMISNDDKKALLKSIANARGAA